MVKISLIKKGNVIVGLTVKGHANSNEYGKDLVCAGISSILTGGFNAIDEKDCDVIKLEEGYAEVYLKSIECNSVQVLNTIVIQLQTMAESYPQNIKIK